jgi:hypothetical protein
MSPRDTPPCPDCAERMTQHVTTLRDGRRFTRLFCWPCDAADEMRKRPTVSLLRPLPSFLSPGVAE